MSLWNIYFFIFIIPLPHPQKHKVSEEWKADNSVNWLRETEET